ncbi:hypothetical protein ACROYT_G040123 [Oculina patagonica]
MSFRQLRSRESESFDDWDDEEDRKPRPNPFSDDLGSFAVIDSDANWVSQEEVADFMKQSRGLALNVVDNHYDEDDKELGPAWGGMEYSLAAGKPRSDSAAKSVRTRPQPSTNSVNLTANKPRSSTYEGPKGQTPPKRPVPPSSSFQRSVTSTSSSASAVSSSPSSSTHVSAAAVRNQTSKVPTTQAALQSVSSSIKDVISSAPQVSVTEYNKLQAEIRQLRNDLQAARKDKSAVPTAQETVKKIIRGQPYTLEVYKSLKDKLSLLDCAIKMHDGNAITTAVLFMKKTVKQRVLYDELKTRPKAVHHLCKYLSEHYDYTELTELYRSVGKFEEAAMIQFQQAIKKKDAGVRLTNLKYILRHYFEGYPQLAEQTTYLTEYIDLLEQQIAIEDADARAELERKNHVMVAHPRQASLPLNSVIVTLYYCCRYHFGEPESIS